MIPIAHSMSSVGGILVCKGDQGVQKNSRSHLPFFQRTFYNIGYPVDLIHSWMMIPKAKLVRWYKNISFNGWFQPFQEKFFKQFR